MQARDRPRKTDRFMFKDLGDEFLLYDPQGEQIHVLNGTAREVLLLCDGRRSIVELVAALVERFEVDEATAERDVGELLEHLSELGAIETEG
ncbi:MAG TPA: PqqD family protein [Candidatus Polarisedimenticolaceae bacterium]|nr:PqqD family protein [Candidatus Polarisedimenticolaceae bacterium]